MKNNRNRPRCADAASLSDEGTCTPQPDRSHRSHNNRVKLIANVLNLLASATTAVGILGAALFSLIAQDHLITTKFAIVAVACVPIGIAMHALAWAIIGLLR